MTEIPRLMPSETRAPHHFCRKPGDCAVAAGGAILGSANGKRASVAESETEFHFAEFDHVALVELGGSGDRLTIDLGHLVAGADVEAIVALADLRGDLGREPSLEADGSHGRLADHGELIREHVLVLIGFAFEYDEPGDARAWRSGWGADGGACGAAGRVRWGATGGHGLGEQLAP